MNKENVYLSCLLLVAFISFLGIALPYPVLAPLFLSKTEGLTFLNISPEILFGIALAVYPLGQFLGSPILGMLSDHWGRKRTLVISLIFTCVGYLISIIALHYLNFITFILSRLFTGFWEGVLPITRAAAADLKYGVSKTKSFGYLNAAATSGYLFGPIFGGVLADAELKDGFNPELIFWFAFAITLTAILVLALFYQDIKTIKVNNSKSATKKDLLKKIKYTWAPFKRPGYFNLIIISTMITLGFDICYQFYPLYLVAEWQATAFDIAVLTMVMSVAMIVTQVFIIKLVNYFLSAKSSIFIFSVFYAVGLLFIGLVNQYDYIYLVFIILGILIGVIGTNLPVFVSDNTDQTMQGQVMGLMMSLRFLGDGLMCLFGGIIASYANYMPFLLAACFVMLGVIMFVKLSEQLRY